MKIPKFWLLIIAGLAWSLAGVMVMATGIQAALVAHPYWVFIAIVIVMLVFYLAIFAPLVKKHEKRIAENPAKLMNWWQFFDKPSYIVMAVMMSGGMALRFSQVLPTVFFSFFYTGLGLALLSCGLRFLIVATQRLCPKASTV